MGAELIAWRPGRLVGASATLVMMVGLVAAVTREPRATRCTWQQAPERSGLRITPPIWIFDDVCGSLPELPSILAFDEPRMQRFCRVLSR